MSPTTYEIAATNNVTPSNKSTSFDKPRPNNASTMPAYVLRRVAKPARTTVCAETYAIAANSSSICSATSGPDSDRVYGKESMLAPRAHAHRLMADPVTEACIGGKSAGLSSPAHVLSV